MRPPRCQSQQPSPSIRKSDQGILLICCAEEPTSANSPPAAQLQIAVLQSSACRPLRSPSHGWRSQPRHGGGLPAAEGPWPQGLAMSSLAPDPVEGNSGPTVRHRWGCCPVMNPRQYVIGGCPMFRPVSIEETTLFWKGPLVPPSKSTSPGPQGSRVGVEK